jgi:hypothetical protein
MCLHTEAEYGKLGSVDRRKKLQKHSYLKLTYGSTLKTYNDMHDAQEGLCAICKEPETGVHNRGGDTVPLQLAVDHDHVTGLIRSLLCAKCNKGLGIFQDNIYLITAAVAYLEAHSKGG